MTVQEARTVVILAVIVFIVARAVWWLWWWLPKGMIEVGSGEEIWRVSARRVSEWAAERFRHGPNFSGQRSEQLLILKPDRNRP